MSMIATYAIAVRSLGDDFEGVRVKASHLAAANACQFWWKPDTSEWHHFIFTNHDVALLFVVYLRSAIIGNNAERIKYVLVTPDEVTLFAEHCVYIRSVYEYVRRLFLESTDTEQTAMTSVAPHFFEDLALVFSEFLVLAACRVTDPWMDRSGRENFVIELFTNAFARVEPLHQQLTDLQKTAWKNTGAVSKRRGTN
jgi:hypothetical protein